MVTCEGCERKVFIPGDLTPLSSVPCSKCGHDIMMPMMLRQFELRGVIGKGGMFAKTRQGLVEHGAVYLHAVGGTAQSLARTVVRVERVFQLEEFGVPEAMWVIGVKDFPTVVTMDAQGGSLHESIAAQSQTVLDKLLGRKTG